MVVGWTDELDEIFAGDQAVALAYGTPADGVVCVPVANFGQRDRTFGTIAVNTSVGMPTKLQRLRANPDVALSFHTRRHSSSNRGEHVLVQGKAALSDPVPDFPDRLGLHWDMFGGPRATSDLWKWWLQVHYTRVEIRITVERITAWPDLACRGDPVVRGAAPPAVAPAGQRPPAKGTGPRVDHRAAARKAAALPDVLLGWMDSDHRPVVVPVGIGDTDSTGIALHAPSGLPEGNRRAGLLAHSFTRHTTGRSQRVHTGWLRVAGGEARYSPHTRKGHGLPASKTLHRLAVGWATRRGLNRLPSTPVTPI